MAGLLMQITGRYFLLNLYGYTLFVFGLLLVLLTTGLEYVSAWFVLGLVMAGYAQGSTSTSTFIAISVFLCLSFPYPKYLEAIKQLISKI